MRRFLIAFAIFGVGLLIPVFFLPYLGFQLTPFGMVPLALPGAYALSGLVEFVTGVSFFELAAQWDQLEGWQRGILGTFIVLGMGAVIICGVALVLAFL